MVEVSIILAVVFFVATVAFLAAFLVYYFKFKNNTCPSSTRVGLAYEPSSNVTPNDIISKVNVVFDDMRPMLCANSQMVNEELEKESEKTCSQMKEELATSINEPGLFEIPEGLKKSIIDLNNTAVDSVCGTDDKIDKTKAAILGSDIKGMFC